MYSISPTGLISLNGRVLVLSGIDQKRLADDVVTRWGLLAQNLSHGVPLRWVLAIIFAESGGNPNALRIEPSGQTGVGLMQITSPVLKGGLSDEQLMNPATNIDLGCRALASIMKKPPVDLPAVASRYNCGAEKDGSPHPRANAWGMCATAGYLERVSAASNTLLTLSPTVPSPAPSIVKPLVLGAAAALVVRRLLR